MATSDPSVALLLRAKTLIDEALWQHIYDEDNGDKPDANCSYSQWLEDCDRYLLEVNPCVES